MAELRLYDTFARDVRRFEPRETGRVGIYVCGPTVYGRIHIGNARPFVVFSLLKRFFEYGGLDVTLVVNVTDVNDKIYTAAAAAGRSSIELAAEMTSFYVADTDRLGLGRPDHEPLASQSIEAIVDYIAALIASGNAYEASGDVYFRVRSDARYGALSRREVDQMDQGEGVEGAARKEDPLDFALWKTAKTGEDSSWEAPWGGGRPGWHIECSAMSMKYLGETIDIHTGGVDLAFPHHENEIAQSEAATGKQFVKIWLHAEHLMVEGEKMSKSTGNYYTLRDLFAKGHRPSSIRFLLLSVPYRRQLNFTMDGLQQAASSVERLRNFKSRVEAGRFSAGDAPEIAARIQAREDEFDEGLSDDLNTAQALAAVFDLVRDINTAIDRGEFRQSNVPIVLAALRKFDEILAVLEDTDDAKLQALGFSQKRSGISDAEIEALVNERQEARRARNFKRGDEIRAQLAASGIILEDMKDGSIRWKRE